MSSDKLFKLHLIKLHGYQQDESDGDEVYLKVNGKRAWPTKEKYKRLEAGTVEIDLLLRAINQIKIELWDYDLLSPDDKLGIFSMLIDEKGGPFITDLKSTNDTTAKYSLEWEVL